MCTTVTSFAQAKVNPRPMPNDHNIERGLLRIVDLPRPITTCYTNNWFLGQAHFRVVSAIWIFLFSLYSVSGAVESNPKDNPKTGYKGKPVLTKEVISGVNMEIKGTQPGFSEIVGFQVLKNFSDRYGDWGKLVCQFRLEYHLNTRVHMDRMRVPFLPSNENQVWQMDFHDVYFSYGGKFKGKFMVRAGRFNVPFGLEENVNTHTTLVQLMSMRNVGFKKDLGLSFKGKLTRMDYDIAITTGGNPVPLQSGNYLISARIGTPADQNLTLGLSGMYGKVKDVVGAMRLMEMPRSHQEMPNSISMEMSTMAKMDNDMETTVENTMVLRRRTGVDLIGMIGPLTLKGETSYGHDADQRVVNTLFQANCILSQQFETLVQFQNARQDHDAASQSYRNLAVGANLKLNSLMTLQTLYTHDIKRMGNKELRRSITARLYVLW